jgi:Undecaprenyl-phosphate glucose phosphotransferase
MKYSEPSSSGWRSYALRTLEVLPLQRKKRAVSYTAIAAIAMTCDTIIIFSANIMGGFAYQLGIFEGVGNIQQSGGVAAIVAALFVILSKSNGLYKVSELLNLKSQIYRIIVKWVVIFLFLSAVAFSMKLGSSFSRGATAVFAVAGLAGLICMRVFWRTFLDDGAAVRSISGQRVVLVGEDSPAIRFNLCKALLRQGLHVIHYFALPAKLNDTQHRDNVFAQVISTVRGSNIEEIVVATGLDNWSELNSSLSALKALPVPVTLIPMGPISNLFRLPSHTIGDTVTIELQRGPLTVFERSIKRMIDIVIAGTAVILILPLLAMTAIAIKLDSGGPIIFRQRRCGFNGKKFYILKFRTMAVLEDSERIESAKRNDRRVTRIGYWLRRTSIDELPQLFNVLRGDMSIVGPRPHALAHDNQFNNLVSKYAYRHHVKPGITGWAQVNGYRGSVSAVFEIEKRVEFDLWYINNWSLAFDFKILFMTAIEVIRCKNAY